MSTRNRFTTLATGLATRQGLMASAAALMMVIGTAAHAGSTTLIYTATEEYVVGPLPLDNAVVTLDYGSTINSFGGYQITGVSGNVDGDVITGLAPTYGPSLGFAAGGLQSCVPAGGGIICSVDQTFFPTKPPLDDFGVSFESATSFYNLFTEEGGYSLLSVSIDDPSTSPIGDAASLSYSHAVPEPAAWALMIVGVGLTGAALRGGKRRMTTV